LNLIDRKLEPFPPPTGDSETSTLPIEARTKTQRGESEHQLQKLA